MSGVQRAVQTRRRSSASASSMPYALTVRVTRPGSGSSSGRSAVAASSRPSGSATIRCRGLWNHSSVDPAVPGYTPLRHTARSLRMAIISSEDTGFWRHDGFDMRQIGVSIARNLEEGTIRRGGSTLTQQLVKNLFLAPEKTLSRKLEEAYLTWRIEQHVSKARILEIYLNIVEWGPGINGVAQASRYYFRKRPSQLSLSEAAFLAAILPNPVRFGARDARGRPSPRVRGRVRRLLRRMVALGNVTQGQVDRAGPVRLQQPLLVD